MFLYLFIIGIIYTNQILAQLVHDVVIPRGKQYEMTNPGYGKLPFGWKEVTIEWNLKVENNDKIKIVCDDIRMNTASGNTWNPDCPTTYVSTIDGNDQKKVCGSYVEDFVVLSKGPIIKFKAYGSDSGSVVFNCTAINMAEPDPTEIIHLEPMGHAKRLIINPDGDRTYPDLDSLWLLESPSGTRISVQCFLMLSGRKPICGKNVFIFNNGETDEEVCDYEFKDYVWFSKTNKAKIRLKLGHTGQVVMNCLIQAVTGPKPNEYENIVFEEVDSSEHGVTPGRTQTSCKCGWTNKSGARIVFGKETKPNEYPWMVQLFVQHGSSDGDIWVGSCGASILTQRHVLTAAHCVEWYKIVASPENVRMELAKHEDKPHTGKEVHAERIFVTEEFMKKDIGFDDIALIFTKETIDFSSPLVGPICIEKFAPPIINKQIKIMGWGITEEKSSSKYLREGKSIVVDWAVCDESPWDICTTSKPSGVCSGDSGGPFVWLNPDTNRFSQVSVASRLPGCGKDYVKSTNVTYFYDWIQEKISETDPSMRTCHEI